MLMRPSGWRLFNRFSPAHHLPNSTKGLDAWTHSSPGITFSSQLPADHEWLCRTLWRGIDPANSMKSHGYKREHLMRRMSWLERSGTYPDSSSMHTLPCAKDHDILSRLFIGIYKPLICRDRRKRGYIRLSNSEASEYINPSMFQKSSCTAVPSSFYITILHREKKSLPL